MFLYLAITAGSWIVTRIPRKAAYLLAWAAGYVAYLIARGPRLNVDSNVSVVLGLPPDSLQVRKTALKVFKHNALNWIDTLRLAGTTTDEVRNRVQVEGWQLIPEALGEGRGLILLGLHLGNMDVVGQIVAARGYPMTVPVEPMRPHALFHRTLALRRSLGINAIPATSAARSLLKVLKRGEIVGIMVDRNLSREGVPVRFFGRDTLVSKGPAWLARRSASPVVLGVGLRDGEGHFQGTVTGPLPVQRTDDEDADLRQNAQTFVSAAEALIRDHADQWVMFVPVWQPGDQTQTGHSKMSGTQVSAKA